MTRSLADIAARLAADNTVNTSATKPRKTTQAIKQNPKQIAHIEDMLLHLLNHEESGTVRIAAARVLLERLNSEARGGKDDDDAKRREQDERAAAISDAQNILAEFAAARTASVPVPSALDTDGAPATVDAAAVEEPAG